MIPPMERRITFVPADVDRVTIKCRSCGWSLSVDLVPESTPAEIADCIPEVCPSAKCDARWTPRGAEVEPEHKQMIHKFIIQRKAKGPVTVEFGMSATGDEPCG